MNQMADEQQRANDMLQLVRNQCTSAQNEVVQVGAELLAANRKIAALEAEIAEMKAASTDDEPKAPVANGHAPEVHAN